VFDWALAQRTLVQPLMFGTGPYACTIFQD
jgi:hypothetical protein